MTLIRRAGRFAGMTAMVGLMLAGCNKGPDRAQVAADLQKNVEGYLAQIEGPQDKRVLNHGSVKVSAQQDAGYLVTIDGLKIGAPGTDYLDVGAITYVLTPKDDKTYDASNLTIPGDMQIKGSDGQPGGDLKVATKAFSGTWLRDAQSFTKLDLELADLVLTDPAHGSAKMAGAAFTIDSTDKGSGLFDQNGKLAMTGIDVSDPTDGHIAIKEVDVTSAIQGLKLMDYAAKLKAMREAMAKPATPAASSTTSSSTTTGQDATTSGDAAASPNPTEAAIRDFASALPSLLASFGTDFHLSGLSYQAADQSSSFDLGKAGFALTASGFDQPKATVKFSIDHDALAVQGAEAQNPLMQAVLPANGALIVSLNGVPTKDLTSLFADAAVAFGHSDPAAMEAQSALLFARLQQLMQQDGVSIAIEPSHLTSAATNVDATGQFAVQAGAVHGAVGSLNLGITGLDQVIALAQKQADEDPEAAQYVAMVQSLLTYATREQGTDGKPIDKFKIDVPQTGQLSVNGKPLPF